MDPSILKARLAEIIAEENAFWAAETCEAEHGGDLEDASWSWAQNAYDTAIPFGHDCATQASSYCRALVHR